MDPRSPLAAPSPAPRRSLSCGGEASPALGSHLRRRGKMSAAAAAPAAAPLWERERLWMFLQALGFQPGGKTDCGKIVTHASLGVSMFDKPNIDAFHVVSYFLFTTLDHSHAKEVFRYCWPPVDRKGDAEYRKQCYEWLRKIADECGSSFPQVVGSLFLSPGGPKFVRLMYQFARFVLMQYIKTNSEGGGTCFVETFNSRPQDLHKSIARYHVTCNRFLRILHKEDFVIQEYQKKAQLLVEQIRYLRSECVELQKELQKMEQYDQNYKPNRVQQVRSMWTSVMETLSALEKEREVVNSVVKGHVDQYALDGTDVAINVPRLLLATIEKQMYKIHMGNVYESGKLNLLTVIQILNEGLKILRHERCQIDPVGLKLDLGFIEGKAKFQTETLSSLKHMRHKMKQEDLVAINQSISEKQRKWEMKWEKFLGQSPFRLIKSWTPALGLLPPMSPLSFEPVSEEAYKNSVFFCYPVSLPDTPKEHSQQNSNNDDGSLGTADSLVERIPPFRTQSTLPTSSNSEILLEKSTKKKSPEWKKTPRRKDPSVSKKTLKYEMDESSPGEEAGSLETRKNREIGAPQTSKPVKDDPFKKEQEHLAEEVAKVILSDSPKTYEEKDMELQELISSLASDPFLTRRQIPRTPENLITEIRSSWRSALQTEDRPNLESFQTGVAFDKALPDSLPEFRNQTDLSMACFLSASSLTDFSQSVLPEEKAESDYVEPLPQVRGTPGPSADQPAQKQTELLNSKRLWERESKCSVVNRSLGEMKVGTVLSAVGKSMPMIDGNAEDFVKLDSLTTYQDLSSMQTSLSWDSSQIPTRTSCDDQFGILHETLPEEPGNLSLLSLTSTEAEEDSRVKVRSPVHSGTSPEEKMGWGDVPQEAKLDFQTIYNRYEALKKCVFEKEDFHPSSETPAKHKSELSLSSCSTRADDDMFNPLESLLTLDMDYIKPSLQMSLAERKQSLSPLIKFSPMEQRRRSMKPKKPGEFLPSWKEENCNKNLGERESPSDSNTKKEETVAQ
ncbi:HAUS augmin-like complex subunit 6 [Tachyglossus aculeatus]|uniref:HAUS augmin-like complex subunit 6 n=1 Tax=Tachyglossus aculeatus TaxID=9261 RepID=UPI0018F2E91E|nr:HAUS augmin-like complex subunit 6 [Tachyglossus aculeatus]